MKGYAIRRLPAILFGIVLIPAAMAADSTRILLGSWSGRATGPQGGPPTGDITVVFERDPAAGISGKIFVKAQGGVQYSGMVSNIVLKNGIFTATAVFKLGENALEANVKGPLKGRTIEGGFSVTAKGQKMGEGTFTIAKEVSAKKAKK